MRKKYIRPRIEVVAQPYGGGVMQTISMPVSTTPSTAQDSKLGGDWGYGEWEEPTAAGSTDDDWGIR